MATLYLQKLRLFSRDVRLYLACGTVVSFTVLMGIYPVLFNLYLARLGYGPEFIGLVAGVSALAFGVFALPAGLMGRRWGSRRMMIAGLTMALVGGVSVPLAEFGPTGLQTSLILTGYLISWLGMALYYVNASPFLTGTTSQEERTHAFSVRAALWALGGFSGTLIGGLLPGLFAAKLSLSLEGAVPYRYALLTGAVLVLPAILLLLATREVQTGQAQARVETKGTVPYGPIVVLALVTLLGSAYNASRIFFNLYLDTDLQMSTAWIGVLMGMGQLLAVPVALIGPPLMARLGTGPTLAWGILGTAISLVLIAFVPHWAGAGLGYLELMALTWITEPASSIYQQEIVKPRWRTTMSGASSTMLGLSLGGLAFSGGYLISALGFRSLFLTSAILVACGALLFWAYTRMPRGEYAQSDPKGFGNP